MLFTFCAIFVYLTNVYTDKNNIFLIIEVAFEKSLFCSFCFLIASIQVVYYTNFMVPCKNNFKTCFVNINKNRCLSVVEGILSRKKMYLKKL